MRRTIGVGVALLLAIVGVFVWRQTQISVAANQIAPDETVFFVELPHLVQTLKNLPDTALYQISQEPSVFRFFKKPALSFSKEYQSCWNSLVNLGCRSLFFCATDSDRRHWIFGFQGSANSTVRTREIQNISRRLFSCDALRISPEQAEKVQPAEDAEGIFFTEIGAWTLVSTNSKLLKGSLRNVRSGAGSLRSSRVFQECRSNVRAAYDLLIFARGGASLDLASGTAWEFGHDESPDAAQAMMATTTIEGARLRDAIFTYASRQENRGPRLQESPGITGPKTIGYLASRLELSALWRFSERFAEDWPVAATLRDYLGETRTFGIEPPELDHLVTGAEIVIDQDPKSEALATGILLQIADRSRFEKLIDRIVQEKFPSSCHPTSIGGIQAYVLSANKNTSLVFGLVEQKLLITWDQSVFVEMVRRLQTRSQGLENNSEFKESASLVAAPDDLFVYIDAKAGFKKLYDGFRPMLVFGAALMPVVDRYVDVMALPETGEIAKHLSPIVLSRHRVAKGFVDESVGPLTAYEVSAFAIGGAMAAGLIQRK